MAFVVSFLIAISYFVTIPSVPVAYADNDKQSERYFFHKHLSEADAFIIQKSSPEERQEKKKKKIFGRWEEDRFLFPELSSEPAISVEMHPYRGVDYEGIFFHPSENAIKVLQFYGVPAGSQLEIYYGIDDVGVRATERATVYFTVWMGQHKLVRIHVPNEEGIKRKVIDLGTVAFLKQPVVVTFEVTSDNIHSRRFGFYAEILK